jgi:thiosulfate/3-mercaptopyruvate sulfurtransferase
MALVSAADLLGRIGSPDLRLADVRWYLGEADRGRAEYEAGHLPGAVFLDLDLDLSGHTGGGRHPLPEPRALAARLADLGFGDEHAIVAYDDASGTVAARLWWMLDALGHRDVAVLDGGVRAWLDAGGRLVTAVPGWPPARLSLAEAWPRTVDRESVAGRLGSGELDLVDVRAAPRYRGEVEPIDLVAGHIPTARNVPTTELVRPDGRMLPPAALAERLAPPTAAGSGGEPNTAAALGPLRVVYCGSGVNACFGVLAHRAAGLPDPLLYAGSYSDWVRAGMPVESSPERGAWVG